MLNRIISNYIFKSILKSLKGKKRWLAIIALVAAYAAQSLGFGTPELSAFVADVVNILQSAEG